MQEIVCHIGFPKTGTTYLQKQVFPKIKYINYVDWTQVNQIKILLDNIINQDDSYYNKDASQRQLMDFQKMDLNMLLSYEPLTGHHIRTQFPNRTQIARRLKALGINKIIITIRNQTDVLESTYKQYIKSGGVLKISNFFDWNNNSMPYFYRDYFNYERIIDLYVEIFGQENVLVIQYEDIFTDRAKFDRQLAPFLNLNQLELEDLSPVKVNKSLSNLNTKLLRIINHFTYNAYRPSNLFSKKIPTYLFYKILSYIDIIREEKLLISNYKEEIRNYFMDSNKSINKKYNLHLHDKYF